MKINKYLPFALVYFFINSVGLPLGLTYTALMSPLFYWWVVATRKEEILLPFLAALTPFIFWHLMNGVDLMAYAVSLVYLTTVYIFCGAFHLFLEKCEDKEWIFRKLLVTNFVLCLIAIACYFTPYSGTMWIDQFLTHGIEHFSRMKMFTYEASYYATLFTPVFFFFFLRLILKQTKMNPWLLGTMLLLPYVLSFSMGVMGCIAAACTITGLLYFRKLIRYRRIVNLFAAIVITGVVAGVLLQVFAPGNFLFLRISNILSGHDLSGSARTVDAFMLADKILALKSYVWGIGWGQIKIIGSDIIRNYYLYPPDHIRVAIPNAVAETWVIFGWVGLSIRLLFEFLLFWRTRVWTNYYRLLLFLFVFLYQFSGSFITNIAEYVIWILAFTDVFPAFDIRKGERQRERTGAMVGQRGRGGTGPPGYTF
jgi:hypothetical protein